MWKAEPNRQKKGKNEEGQNPPDWANTSGLVESTEESFLLELYCLEWVLLGYRGRASYQ